MERERGRYVLVDAGAVVTDPGASMPERLLDIHRSLTGLLALYAPDAIAVEQIFAHKSAASALVLGQARGVALVAAAASGKPVFEYNASTIKRSVAGSGSADKKAVARMVQMLIGAEVQGPSDATDAVALAITHHAHVGAPGARVAAAGAAPTAATDQQAANARLIAQAFSRRKP